MWNNEFNYLDPSKALDVCLRLNNLVQQPVEDVEQIEMMILENTGENVSLRLCDALTPNGGPIYQFLTEIYEVPVCIYVGDFYGEHTIIAVTAGMQATYASEDIKNIIKGSVN